MFTGIPPTITGFPILVKHNWKFNGNLYWAKTQGIGYRLSTGQWFNKNEMTVVKVLKYGQHS